MENKSLKFGIVAAEVSGDALGARMIAALKERYPQAEFYGIGGDQMRAHNCFTCWYDMQQITAIGPTQYIAVYRRAFKILFDLLARFTEENKIDYFIAVDAPEFNMPLARRLKKHSIASILYVSPTFWAWRKKRLFKVMDVFKGVLCLYPFEVKLYREHDFTAFYVGHPALASEELQLETAEARHKLALNIPKDTLVLTCFVGSRTNELKYNVPIAMKVLSRLRKEKEKWHFIFNVTQEMHSLLLQELTSQKDISIFVNKGQTCLAAADIALVKSGTSTLEATLCTTPMVIYYGASLLARFLFRTIGSPLVGLPNYLAGKIIVPEIVDGRAKNISQVLLGLIRSKGAKEQKKALCAIRETMQTTQMPLADAVAEILYLD